MRLITLYLPESYLRALDELVEKRYYPSRAEAIRVAIRDLLNKEFWGREDIEGAKDFKEHEPTS